MGIILLLDMRLMIILPLATINIAIGLFAIHDTNCTGHNNIAIGGSSGKAISSGYGNTCVGQGSGFKISSGFNNQCFGRYAGYWCNTGDANICIGFSAGPKDTGGGQLNNRLYIGNIDHANSRGIDSYVYGDMTPGSEKWCFNANVGIGTTTLASSSSGNIKLDVHENGTTGWTGTGVFGNQNQKVIIGVHSNVATIGGHNQALTALDGFMFGFWKCRNWNEQSYISIRRCYVCYALYCKRYRKQTLRRLGQLG